MSFSRNAVNLIEDGWRVVMLRMTLVREKLRRFDAQAEELTALREAYATLQRSQAGLMSQLEERDAALAGLRADLQAADTRLAARLNEAAGSERLALFRALQPVLTQLPTMRRAVNEGADLAADDILDLVAPLETALADLGFVPIGAAGEAVAFDPKLHQAVGQGAGAVLEGAPVRVRYVGYLYQGDVVTRAEVTRIADQDTIKSGSNS